MKKIVAFLFVFSHLLCDAQIAKYKKTTAMIPMRDGVKLFTVIYSPIGNGSFPFMIERTPYGARESSKDTADFSKANGYKEMANDGYIFVFQDIRGKYKSEGQMEMNKPMYHATDPKAIDESTDTYDAIDWLLK